MSEEVAKPNLTADNQPPAQAPEETQELLALQPPNSQPVRKLAPELLTIVFEHALPADWTTTEPGRQTLNFAQVDHTWRAVAISSPSLWKKIYWKIPSPHADGPQHEDAIALYLQRSRKASLSVQIVFESQDADVIRVYLQDNGAWKLLCAEAYRWQCLTLSEVLCIFVSQPHPDVAREPMLLFRSTPALQHLGIRYPLFCNFTLFPRCLSITSLFLRFGHPRHTPSVEACADLIWLWCVTPSHHHFVTAAKSAAQRENST